MGMGVVGIASQRGDRITVVTGCPFCHKRSTLEVSEAAYERWQAGELVQNAFPDLDKAQREQLVSGFCDPCWQQVFVRHDYE